MTPRLVKFVGSAAEEESLVRSLLAWAAEHYLTPADLAYIHASTIRYIGAASGVAGARVRARARVN